MSFLLTASCISDWACLPQIISFGISYNHSSIGINLALNIILLASLKLASNNRITLNFVISVLPDFFSSIIMIPFIYLSKND